jgi:hypothetical protein
LRFDWKTLALKTFVTVPPEPSISENQVENAASRGLRIAKHPTALTPLFPPVKNPSFVLNLCAFASLREIFVSSVAVLSLRVLL